MHLYPDFTCDFLNLYEGKLIFLPYLLSMYSKASVSVNLYVMQSRTNSFNSLDSPFEIFDNTIHYPL